MTDENRHYIAGENILLNFNLDNTSAPLLLVENALGSTLLEGKSKQHNISYHIPEFFTKKAGKFHWKLLLGDTMLLEGGLTILPSPIENPHHEAYFGPPSLLAGNTDYAMLIAVPVDKYDNPLTSGSRLWTKEHYLTNTSTDTLTTKNLLAWKRVYSRNKAGKLLVGTNTLGSRSKELTTTIYPDNAVDFKIKASMTHHFADGNQIISFLTSELIDQFGNTVSDGTQVHFSIATSNGELLSSWASSMQGVATAKLLHPERAEQWKVTAYISGAAKSNTLEVNFKNALTDFDFSISENGQKISVGPLESFLDQLIPDGMQIDLKIQRNGQIIQKLGTNSRKGMGFFEFDKDIISDGPIEVEITVGGITKTRQLPFNE